MKLSERCDDNCGGYICEFHALRKSAQDYIVQLEEENEVLKKKVARGYVYIFPRWIKKFLGE